MFFNRNKEKSQPAPKELLKQVETLEKNFQELSKEFQEYKQRMRKAVCKVGVVRFNPFRETGSDQSFVIALLNEDNDGFVVMSHYMKEYNRIYTKPITGGKSEYSLSQEEEEAVEKAVYNQ